MVKFEILITQDNKSSFFNEGREDLIINKEITLMNGNNSNASLFKWEFISWPQSFYNEQSPEIINNNKKIAKFTPKKLVLIL